MSTLSTRRELLKSATSTAAYSSFVLLVAWTAMIQAEERSPSAAGTSAQAIDATHKFRDVVQNALTYLDGSGAKLVGQSCINCHHAPLRGWALREASRMGLEIDATALQKATSDQLEKLSGLKDDYRDKQWGHSLSAFFVLGSSAEPAQASPKGGEG